jgi:putative ABC transport system permease protein
MIKNYCKTAFRNLWKNKTFGFLNIMGLGVSIACAGLIMLWLEDEWNYNDSLQNKDNIYQFLENQTYEGTTYTFAAMPGPFAAAAREEIPGIKRTARMDWGNQYVFEVGEKVTFEKGMMADSPIFRILSLQFISGNGATAFAGVNNVVISDKMAKKFFGTEDATGKMIRVNNKEEYTITGVFRDIPANSTYTFDWLMPMTNFERDNPWSKEWKSNGVQTFAELEPNANTEAINARLKNYIQGKDTAAMAHPFLASANDWRLRNNYVDGKQSGGRIEYVRLFSVIALIILFIACINFMNLSTARSEQRAREVGVRKVMGAGKVPLVLQFMTESVMLAYAAVVFSLIIIALSLSSFNLLVGKQLAMQLLNPTHLLALVLIGLVTGILAGSYPSLYLSSFNPVGVLKAFRAGAGSSAVVVRKGLVVSQFVISTVLIICTIVIYQQIQHVKSRPLGFDKENLLSMELSDDVRDHFEAVRHDLLETGAVADAAITRSSIINMGSNSDGYDWEGKSPETNPLVTQETVSPHYISTMGLRLTSGRDFYETPDVDSTNVIINATMAKIMKKEDPIGMELKSGDRKLRIIGVVNDFIYNNMYTAPAPLVFYCDPEATGYLFVRLKKSDDAKAQIAAIGKVMNADNPGYPFEFRFLDEDFERFFRSEMLIGKLSRLFGILAIFITYLGLFGLAAYTAERRTKEIGIRKVLGASLTNIVTMLSRDFIQLVSIGALIAFPLAWLIMNKWLDNYAYRITMAWWTFLIAGMLALVIALLTVSFQAVKAGLMNPVKSLRTE